VRYDAIVVGAGAMGSATAWQLARRGCSVLLLEQFEPGHARGSSHGPTRIFRLAYRDRRYLRLALEALPLWRELEAEAGETLLEQDGQLDHGAPEAIGAIASNLRAAGRACEELSPAAARERWPGMRFDRSVVFSPEGGRCYAQATVRALLRLCAARGVDVRFGARVARVVPDGEGAHVTAPDGEYHARAVVVAAGGWVRKLVGSGARGLPELRVTREQPAHFALRDASLCYPAFIHHVHAGVPAHLGFATYGLSTPELGVKVGEHGIGIVVDPDEAGPGPDPTRLERLSRYVAEWLPGLDPRPVESTPCLYTSTPDEHFVLDRRGPIVVCSACSGHGFKFTPVIGRIAADLALGAEQPEPAWRLREGEPAAG
jgi:sarcosine oxidase